MKKIFSSIFAFAAVLFCSLTQATNEHKLSCPESITEQATVTSAPKDWQVITTKGPRYLESASIYLEHLGEYSAQIPDNDQNNSQKEILTWNINSKPGFNFFVGCVYTNTSAILYKKISDQINRCILTYELLPTGKRQQLESIICQ